MSLPNSSVWQVQLLRVTAFIKDNDRAKEENWWASLFGEPSETRTVRSKEGLFQDEGTFGEGRLILAARSGRVDWTWSVSPIVPIPESPTIPSLGTLVETSNTLCERMNVWLDLAPSLTRLAFAAVLDQPVAEKEEAYRLLQQYLSAVQLSPDSSSDFLYQINRPVASKTLPGHKINRLNKWATLKITITGIRNDETLLQKELKVIRLEVDVNTAPEKDMQIPKEKGKDILRELANLAQELATKGDQPS